MQSWLIGVSEEQLISPSVSVCRFFFVTIGPGTPLLEPIIVQQFNLKSDLRKGGIRSLLEAIAGKQLPRLLLIQDLPKTQHITG
jgi:hypothetical protein